MNHEHNIDDILKLLKESVEKDFVKDPLQTKEDLAYVIWDQLIKIRAEKGID